MTDLPYWDLRRKDPPTSEDFKEMARTGKVFFPGGMDGFDLTDVDKDVFLKIADTAPHILIGWLIYMRQMLRQ